MEYHPPHQPRHTECWVASPFNFGRHTTGLERRIDKTGQAWTRGHVHLRREHSDTRDRGGAKTRTSLRPSGPLLLQPMQLTSPTAPGRLHPRSPICYRRPLQPRPRPPILHDDHNSMQVWSEPWARSFNSSRNPNASAFASFAKRARSMTASSRRVSQKRDRRIMRPAAARPIATMELSGRDQHHRRALQTVRAGKLPRANRYHIGLRRSVDAVLPDGRAAARRMDATASSRASRRMALRDGRRRSQGRLG